MLKQITSYVRYHTLSNNKTRERIRKINLGKMVGLLKFFTTKSYEITMAYSIY